MEGSSMRLSLLVRQLFAYIGVTVITFGFSAEVLAAEKVVLKYKLFRGSLSVADLTTFAQTGDASPALQSYLSVSGQNPENVRNVLTQNINVNVVTLDRLLSNPVGNLVLDRVGSAVQTPANVENRKALRSALLLSASRDSQVSLNRNNPKLPYFDG
jgi:hypothetical protein